MATQNALMEIAKKKQQQQATTKQGYSTFH